MTPRRPRATTAAVPLIATLALTAAGCLTASQESRVQTDLDQLRQQMFAMQKDTAAMTAKLAAIEEKLGKQDTSQPARWADMQALLQSLTDEIRTLGARLDDNGTRMGSLSRDISATRDQYRALDARIAAALGEKGAAAPPPSTLEPPSGSTAAAAVPSAASPRPGPATPSGGPTPGGSPANATPPGGSSAPAPGASPRPGGSGVAAASLTGGSTASDDAAQEETFRGAYSDYTRGNYDLALAGFQNFLSKYPTSPSSGGAMYYSGECLFSQQKYQEAADAFGRAVAEHPNLENAAAAYLKRGLSLLALKQTAQGVVQLQHVIDAYPRSEEARIAADRLRQLGLRDR
ncbi:MAG: tol-pal system protein YbgF [Acidobacteria bacterium]|nr:tol-pal system protein YbgF [Acidobacteriota bacterium]